MRHSLIAVTLAAVLGMAAGVQAGTASAANDATKAEKAQTAQDTPRLLTANGPVQEFVLARTAAEVCRGRNLTETEDSRFLRTLQFRDPKHRDLEPLADHVATLSKAYSAAIRQRGCDDVAVQKALSDWDVRVTLFARIAPRAASTQFATGEQPTAR